MQPVYVAFHIGGKRSPIRIDRGVREPNFADALPGVLASIDDDESFAAAPVDPVAGTVAWPNGIDLDPDVLHGDQQAAAATQPRLLRKYRLERSG